ncbi:ABC transporter ATP-binding protein [Rhizobium leguminosarum]|uniref:ABC transporter ATP-binding protein n=1 Tax=Rhizobium leguminosarum TaxID=384 RepID=UPI0024A9AA7A|nr:ABC transporter ATP-binding protein [Rhizobium leguminosarum]MDI5929996.1 ABC transporter ATP-binding protein [Rhizobium leguminosarum]
MTANAGSSIQLVNISKEFGDFLALPELSLTISPGEFVSFLGPSGSGKTTTLNIIAGFIEPTSGDVLIDGASITGLPPHRRNLGMVFQQYALFPHITVAENVAFPLRRRRVSQAEISKRVAEALELVGLDEKADALPRQLSGGQQQRVALARAIVYRPRVLLMDEPLGALDKKLRERLQHEIKRIHRDLGITFVFVTHDQEEALTLSDRIVVFDQGKIVQVGTGTELYERPENRFVAEFIGEVNIFSPAEYGPGQTMRLDSGDVIQFTHASKAGQKCVLAVRPERLKLAREAPEQGDNRLLGQVSSVDYFGASRRVGVDVPGLASTIWVREALHGNSPNISLDDRFYIHWCSGEGTLLPA